jgi:hypothetical protein
VIKTQDIRSLGLTGSIALYAGSLFLPAILYEAKVPSAGLELLLTGALGILAGSIAWFANPAYWLALLMFFLKRYRAARVFAGIATGIGLTAIFLTEMPGASSSTMVAGLGPGFAVWIVALVLLQVSSQYMEQAEGTDPRNWRLNASGWISAALAVLAPPVAFMEYSQGRDAPARIQQERSAALEAHCRTAGEKLIRAPEAAVRGLHFSRDSFITYAQVRDVRYQDYRHGDIGHDMVAQGWLDFAEVHNNPILADTVKGQSVRRFEGTDAVGRQGNDITAAYGLVEKWLADADAGEITRREKKLGIDGFEFAIRHLKSGETFATTRIFTFDADKRFCGAAPSGQFDTRDFVIRAMHLQRNPAKPPPRDSVRPPKP